MWSFPIPMPPYTTGGTRGRTGENGRDDPHTSRNRAWAETNGDKSRAQVGTIGENDDRNRPQTETTDANDVPDNKSHAKGVRRRDAPADRSNAA